MDYFDKEISRRLKGEEPDLPESYSGRIDGILSNIAQYEHEKHVSHFRVRAAVTFVAIFFIVSATICASMNYYHMSNTGQKSLHASRPDSKVSGDKNGAGSDTGNSGNENGAGSATGVDGDNIKETQPPVVIDDIRLTAGEYDVAKFGKRIDEDGVVGVANIRFSNKKIVCCSTVADSKSAIADGETVYLYDRKTKKSHRIMTIENYNSAWGDMCEKDGFLYMAVGTIEDNGEEKSYIVTIDEKKLQGKLIEINNCNTEFSRVFCTNDAVYVWYLNERGSKRNIEDYCLCKLENDQLKPVETWTFENRTDKAKKEGTGQIMSVMGTNDTRLFCYVRDGNGDAYVNVYDNNDYDKKGQLGRGIPVDFTDFLKLPDNEGDMDVIFSLYCCGNTLFFQTLNNRVLVAEYDEKNMMIKRADCYLASSTGDQAKTKLDLSGGDYRILGSFSDKIVLQRDYEDADELYIWNTASRKIQCIIFPAKKSSDYSYRMLSEDEVILGGYLYKGDERYIYCPLK